LCEVIGKPQPTEGQRIGNEINAAVGNWSAGRTTWIAGAHRDRKRFIIRADEKLTAFVELERAIHEFAVSLIS
jgi:hypothetical protein